MLERVTSDDYQDAQLDLLPPGKLWGRGGRLARLFSALGDEWARVHGRAIDLVDEADPRTTDELLEDWERVYGLDGSGTDDERRAALVARIVATGGASEAYWIEIAEALGVTITITTVTPFRVDLSTVETPLYEDEWAHWWLVTGPAATSAALQAHLEAIFTTYKPAHTAVHFSWTA